MIYEHEQTERVAQKVKPYPTAPMPRVSSEDDDWVSVERYFWGRELSGRIAHNNGWYPSRDAGDGALRIVIPATNSVGFPFWQARAINSLITKRYQSQHGNRGDSVIVVWPEGEPRLVAVTEGPMDALAAAGEGVLGIALMGNTPSWEILRYVATFRRGIPMYVFADTDSLYSGAYTTAALTAEGRFVTYTSTAPFKDLAAVPKDLRHKWLN